MDAFVNYETDWKELRDSIRKRAELIPTCRGDAKRKEIKLAQGELEEAEEIVSCFVVECRFVFRFVLFSFVVVFSRILCLCRQTTHARDRTHVPITFARVCVCVCARRACNRRCCVVAHCFVLHDTVLTTKTKNKKKT